MNPRPDLKVVDPDTGELHDTCPNCAEAERTYAELERKYRGALSQIGNLRADRDAAARDHNLWGVAVAVFQEWKLATGHSRSAWTAERFWLVLPYLETDGFGMCLWAVWGVGHMPYTRRLPTGLVERYDDWETCFKNRANFERFVRRGFTDPEARRHWAEVFPVNTVAGKKPRR